MKINILEASTSSSGSLTPTEKMRLFNTGARKENVKACSDIKLIAYFNICMSNDFYVAGQKILDEIFARKISSTTINPFGRYLLCSYALFNSIITFLKTAKPDHLGAPTGTYLEEWAMAATYSPYEILQDIYLRNRADWVKNGIKPSLICTPLSATDSYDTKWIESIRYALIILFAIAIKAPVEELNALKELFYFANPDFPKDKKILKLFLHTLIDMSYVQNFIAKNVNAAHGLQEKIVKVGNKWQVQSEDGTKNLGTYDTKKEAEKRLQQVHYFKHLNEADDTLIISEDWVTDKENPSYVVYDDPKDLKAKLANVEIYEDKNGNCPAQEFIDGIKDTKTVANLLQEIADLNKSFSKLVKAPAKDEWFDKVYTFEPKTCDVDNEKIHFTFFVAKNKFVLANGYKAKGKYRDTVKCAEADKFRTKYIKAHTAKIEEKLMSDYFTQKLQQDDKLKQLFYKTDDEQLEENIEKHDELNQIIFDGDRLKPIVRLQALKIVSNFVKKLKEDSVKLIIKDIVLTGSNASYNYTKDSDIDIHIIADIDQLHCPDNLYPVVYNAYKTLFNKDYDISFYGIPVEIYVETSLNPGVSNGIYSILNNDWVKVPDANTIPEVDQAMIDTIVQPWITRYNELINDKNISVEAIDKYIDDLYALRLAGFVSKSEYSNQNYIFKEIRNLGYLDYLKKLKKQLESKKLSLN